MKKFVIVLAIACIIIAVACCFTESEKKQTEDTTTKKQTQTEKRSPWVCYDCGHEGNEGEVCSECSSTPDSSVTADGLIKLHFGENPSTGFEWSYTVTPEDALERVSSGFKSKMSPKEQEILTGVGGTHSFCFSPVKDGKVTLRFTLSRGFDDIDSELIYTYKVKDGIPTRVHGERNYWICDNCGRIHDRLEQSCYSCDKTMTD